MSDLVMVIEDEKEIRDLLRYNLERAGFRVSVTDSGEEGLERIFASRPDAVIVDLMLPGRSGLEVVRELRDEPSTHDLPVLVLTARAAEMDKLLGFDHGADDYVTKPFSPRELALRVRSVLRRAQGALIPSGTGVLRDGDLVVDISAHEASLDGKILSLTAREFDLLAYLLNHPRQAFAREQLLEHVWGWSFGDSSTVTVHVRRLREKIEPDPTNPTRIQTVWGVGYRYGDSAR